MADGPYALRLGLAGIPASVQAAAIGAIAEALHGTGGVATSPRWRPRKPSWPCAARVPAFWR